VIARRLGRTAVTVTELGFGAALLGNLYAERSDAEVAAAIQTAWEGGVRYFDVAPHYGLGLAERRLGGALAGRPREQFVVSTKVGRLLEPNPTPRGSDLSTGGFAVPDVLRRRRDYSADGVRRSLDESLERLGLDRVDVLLVHDPEQHMEQALREAVPALLALREQGVIGALGVGMNLAEPLRRFVRETDVDVVLIAGRYTLVDRTATGLLDDCAARGVSAIVAAPFNSGLLAHEQVPDTARFDYVDAPADVVACARDCEHACARHRVALPAAALRFGLRHPATACVLAGMGTAAEVTQNLAWLRAPLPEALWDDLPAPARR
jgi:D-threo-aldose 1-dehydrogenase